MSATVVDGTQHMDAELSHLSESDCVVTGVTVAVGGKALVRLDAYGYGVCAASGTIIQGSDGCFAIEFAEMNSAFRQVVCDLDGSGESERSAILVGIYQVSVTIARS